MADPIENYDPRADLRKLILHVEQQAAEIERLRAALGPLLSPAARKMLSNLAEDEAAMGSRQLSEILLLILDSDARRAALAQEKPNG